jgi:hypothetical protein
VSPQPGASAFAGSYFCTVTATVQGQAETSSTALTITASGDTFTVSDADGGASDCNFQFIASGDSATAIPKACAAGSAFVTLTSGTGTLDGNILTLTLAVTVNDGSTNEAASETLTCTRQ